MNQTRANLFRRALYLHRLPGFASIRGRFFYLAAGFLFYLLFAGWLADSFTSQTVENVSEKLFQSQHMQNAVGRILFSAWQLEYLLDADLNRLDEAARTKIRSLAFDLFSNVRVLDAEHLPSADRVNELARSLVANIDVLRQVLKPWLMDAKAVDRKNLAAVTREIREVGFALTRAIQVSSSSNVANLSSSSKELKTFFWLLALTGFVLMVLAYLFFSRLIHRPMAEFVHLLEAEVRGGEPGVIALPGSTRETSRLLKSFSALREQVSAREGRLQTILDNTAEAIITVDENGIIESFNCAAEKLFGFDSSEVVGKNMNVLLPSAMREHHVALMNGEQSEAIRRIIGRERELVAQRKGGVTFPVSVKITEVMLGQRKMYIALVADISERKAIMDHLRYVAERDPLTGLYNRTYFHKELQKAVDQVNAGRGRNYAVLYVDLDNFKYVNDTLGHAAGDRMIMDVVKVLKNRVRKDELVARFGGDEFTILLQEGDEQTALLAAESFRNTLENQILLHEGKQSNIRCSIGVAIVTPDLNAHEVLSRADLACHLAKREGRNRVHMFSAVDANDLVVMSHDMGWSRRIKDAVEKNRLVLACQPIVDTRTHEVYTYEVLVRMLDDDDSIIMPGGFMPAAERFGQASDIDNWVIANAIKKLVGLQQRFPQARFTINLSGQSLSQKSVLNLIRSAIDNTGVAPASLIFEITETVAIADMGAATEILSAMQAMGCRTALDDFGAGMSSFAYLKDLPVDIVKIDGRFVKNLDANPVDQAMVKAMNEVSHALGKQVVAEFVENEDSYRLLAEFGVDFAQGYHLGRPQLLVEDDSPGAGPVKIKSA